MLDSKLAIELKSLIKKKFSNAEVAQKFLERIEQGKLTIDENSQSHFCVYFAAYDQKAKQVFIGHHKKADKWLVNGGHIDKGETSKETLIREIDEKWGLNYKDLDVSDPLFLTITEIYNPGKQPCRMHFDVWCFVSVDKNNFDPDKNKLAEEFYENRWVDFNEAKSISEDNNHNKALNFVENNLLN